MTGHISVEERMDELARIEALAERLMHEFYLSPAYDPLSARHADTVRAAISFALHNTKREQSQ